MKQTALTQVITNIAQGIRTKMSDRQPWQLVERQRGESEKDFEARVEEAHQKAQERGQWKPGDGRISPVVAVWIDFGDEDETAPISEVV